MIAKSATTHIISLGHESSIIDIPTIGNDSDGIPIVGRIWIIEILKAGVIVREVICDH